MRAIVFDYIEGDSVSRERTPLDRLARAGGLVAFRHTGFWKPQGALRDRWNLKEVWASGKAPWKTW
jgi:glucose-1-phosphate cytidylyltransferase